MTKFEENVNTELKKQKMSIVDLAERLGISRSTYYNKIQNATLDQSFVKSVNEILNINQNNDYTLEDPNEFYLKRFNPNIPMYNFPASASNIEMYNDANDVKIVGHLNIPGAVKGSFALPVYGHSMYPTLENGAWCVLRPIENKLSILWGEIYYIEWGDYRMYKRLLKGINDKEVILWSDNQLEKIADNPKYSPIKINAEVINKLALVTDILKKPNY